MSNIAEGQENRLQDSFGNLLIETGTNIVGTGGAAAYTLQAMNPSKVTYRQGLNENGMSVVYSEGTYQIEAGVKGQYCNQGVGYVLQCHNGDAHINADKGNIGIKARVITLDASDRIVIKAPQVDVGNPDRGYTETVNINGRKVNINPSQHCHIKTPFKTIVLWENPFQCFADALIAGKAMGALGVSGIKAKLGVSL